MTERIAILGGSSVYIPGFIVSLISHNINVKEVVLVGRPGPKLPLVASFCQRVMDQSGFPAKVIAETDVAEGVKGAAYILNHVRVGGMKARIRDEKLPPRYGMVGDETLGAGGIANALRSLPVTLEHAAIVEKVNPEAVFINLTNPTGIIIEALSKYTRLQAIGVCDLPGTYVKKVAAVLRLEPSEIMVDYIGLNHLGWIQDVKVNGRSCLDRVLERLESHGEDGFDFALIEAFRMIPTRSVGLYFHRDEVLKKQAACNRFRSEVLDEAEPQILKLYEDPSLVELPELTRARNPVWYEETLVPLIQALESRTDKELILCVRNQDSIRDLPEEASVEIPAKVSKKGVQPRKVGSCPRFLKGLFLSIKESDRLIVEAVRHRSYEYALQALAINPFVPSVDTARKFLDRILQEEGIELH